MLHRVVAKMIEDNSQCWWNVRSALQPNCKYFAVLSLNKGLDEVKICKN